MVEGQIYKHNDLWYRWTGQDVECRGKDDCDWFLSAWSKADIDREIDDFIPVLSCTVPGEIDPDLKIDEVF